MTCHITGPVVILDGTPAANRQLTIRSEDFIVNAQGTLVVLPEEIVTYTDLLGEVSFDLMPGSYSGFYVSSPDGRTAFRLRVPSDTPTATFSSLLVASSVSYDPALTKLILDANEVIQNGGGGEGGGPTAWGNITGTLSNQTDLNSALAAKASTASVALKANITDVTAGLALKADTTAVDAALALKADTTALALKANVTDVLAGLATKADVAHTHTFSSLTSKPTDLDGYGITDAVGLSNTQTITGKKHFSEPVTFVGRSGDPSSHTDGEVWYRSDLGLYRAKANGRVFSIPAPGGDTSISTNTTVTEADSGKTFSATASLTLTLPATPEVGFSIQVTTTNAVSVTLVPGSQSVQGGNTIWPGTAVDLIYSGGQWRRSFVRGFGTGTVGALGILPDADNPDTPAGLWQITAATANTGFLPSFLTGYPLLCRIERINSGTTSQTIYDPVPTGSGVWARCYGAGSWSALGNGGAIASLATTELPTGVSPGTVVWNTTLNQLVAYDGSVWVSDAPAVHNHSWTDISDKPTTLAGYGIGDAWAEPFRSNVAWWAWNGYTGTGLSIFRAHNFTTSGTLGGANLGNSLYGCIPKGEYLWTSAATNAVAGFRSNGYTSYVGGPSDGVGGFSFVGVWGPATGCANTSKRGWFGLGALSLADTDPSAQTNCVQMGYDSADTNVQMMCNDASGVCTKIDLGASFPIPTTDRSVMYRLEMFSPPGTTQLVDYIVTDLISGAVASGTLSGNLPSTSTAIGPRGGCSVGGVSSVVGIAVSAIAIKQGA